MYIYCVYPAISKSPDHLPNCLKITETYAFNGVLCDVSAYTITFLSVAPHESGTSNALLGPWHTNTEVYLTPFVSTQNHTIAG